jgi:glycosyltransferase involved in cell wall biosynthesis
MLKMLYRAVAERRYLDEAAFLHAVSQPDAEGARAVGVRSAIEVIPNGIAPSEIRRTNAPPLSRRFPRLAGLRVLLFIGRLDPQQKGLDVLISALADSDPRLGLVLVGPSFRGSRERLAELARQVGVDGRVEFPGPIFGTEKLDVLSGADVFVHPSRWEGLPFSVLEAAACGVPGVISASSDPTGLLRSGGGAIAGEAERASLAAALSSVAAMTDEELAAMGRKARAVVTEHFDWDTISKRVLRAYEEHCRIP